MQQMQTLKDKVLRASRTTITTQSFFSVAQTEDAENQSAQLKCGDDEILFQMNQLIVQSSGYEDTQVVSFTPENHTFKTYETLNHSLAKFVQVRPSDEQLLHEQDYITKRKVQIRQNLEVALSNIDSLIPSGIVSLEQTAQRQMKNKRILQHYKKIFSLNQKEDTLDQILAPFLTIYKQTLDKLMKTLPVDSKSAANQRQRSTVRLTTNASDEKYILEEKRKELHNLDLAVFKIAIALARISFYTMGIILPRDQNLRQIPYFGDKDPLYDYQTCLEIVSLFKHQIERMEHIERQLAISTHSLSSNFDPRASLSRQSSTTQRSAYFDRADPQGVQQLLAFRENFQSDDSKKRCGEIWKEFAQDPQFSADVSTLQVNLHANLTSLSTQMLATGYQVILQIFLQPGRPHSEQIQVTATDTQWLFTEVKFAETLLKDDLIMLVKVYKTHEIKELKSKQQIKPKSAEPMKLSSLSHYSIVNLTDAFLENHMLDGRTLEPAEIKFYEYDSKYNLDQDYDIIQNELRYNTFKGSADDQFSKNLSFQLKFTFMSSINRNSLCLGLQKSVVMRPKTYWDCMVREKLPAMKDTDPQLTNDLEYQLYSLEQLQRKETTNEFRVILNSLQFRDKIKTENIIFRVQVYVIEKKVQYSSSILFVNHLMQNGPGAQLEETIQSPIATLNKKGAAIFKKEFTLKILNLLKTKDLNNFKLMFFVFAPNDKEMVHTRITEQMVDAEPNRYLFYPLYFGKLSLLDKATGYLHANYTSREISVPLMKFNPSKYLQDQINSTNETVGASLTLNLQLISQEMSNVNSINRVIDAARETTIADMVNIVQSMTNNDLLVYHKRVINSLLYSYSQTESQQDSDTALKCIFTILKRFDSPELKPFKRMVEDFPEQWRGDRDRDMVLYLKLMIELEKMTEQIQTCMLDEPLERNVTDPIKNILLRLQHLPMILALVCKLFCSEFKMRYATITELITTYFRKWMSRDLAVYRPDIHETKSTLANYICSKPLSIVLLLEQDVNQIHKAFKQSDQQQNAIDAVQSDDDSVENENPFGGDSDEDDDFQFVEAPRQSIQRRTTFHNQTTNDIDSQMLSLQKQTGELRMFQQDFCARVQKVLIETARYLHEDMTLDQEDPNLAKQIKRINHILTSDEQNKDEMSSLFGRIYNSYRQKILAFPEKAKKLLASHNDRRRELRQAYYTTLQGSLGCVLNFINRQFVENLFDERYLLRLAPPVIDRIADMIIPDFTQCTKTYGQFNKTFQDIIRQKETLENFVTAKQDYEKFVNQATFRFKQLRDEEQKDIDKRIKYKVFMFSELVASNTFIQLPDDSTDDLGDQDESLQQLLATKISLAVCSHLKQYKNQFVGGELSTSIGDRTKDSTPAELKYLFLYHMSEFEKRWLEFNLQQQKDYLSSSAQVIGSSMPTPRHPSQVMDFEDEDLLSDLAMQPKPKSVFVDGGQDKKLNLPTFQSEENKLNVSIQVSTSQGKEQMDSLLGQFDPGSSERRLCFFLNEMEDFLENYHELRLNAQQQALQVSQLAQMKKKYASLFNVLAMQSLTQLTSTAFLKLYAKRPGCLDRLVKQVRSTVAKMEFAVDEQFFEVKKLQVLDQFCRNVIKFLCDLQTKRMVEKLSDKYTYKSIISQIWMLQLELLAEQGRVLFEFQALGNILKTSQDWFKITLYDFQTKLQTHNQTQISLWNNYKNVGDLILPEADAESGMYANIIKKIIKIFQSDDLEDTTRARVDQTKLQYLISPIALVFAQLDELNLRLNQQVSYSVFRQMERMIKDVVDYNTTSKNANLDIIKSKKKQICDTLCKEYFQAAQKLSHLQVQDQMFDRAKKVTEIKDLYMHVLNYEATKQRKGNLLAQLIAYYNLMLILSENDLSSSFQDNINVKYRQMIDNINAALWQSYTDDVEREGKDETFICQKGVTQYKNQMKEVKAFMRVENYYRFKASLEKGLLEDDGRHTQSLLRMIDSAVELLVPQGEADPECPPNQFFDKAIELLLQKRALQATNYEFGDIITTLHSQIRHYELYQQFVQKMDYCNYYRIKVEDYLPPEMQREGRKFVYRTPMGYKQEFIKSDLATLLNNPEARTSMSTDVRPMKPLTPDVRQKYNIVSNPAKLLDTPILVTPQCPAKFHSYYKQNYQRQFYFEQCPSLDPAQFNEEFVITVNEVERAFPTMTMIQEVCREFVQRIPRVKVQLYQVNLIQEKIKHVIKVQSQNNAPLDDEFSLMDDGSKQQNKQGQASLEDIIKEFITNDDVGGGLPKILDLFFNTAMAQNFIDLKNAELKRSYLDLFNSLDQCMIGLYRVVEVFRAVGRNQELTKLAEERLEDRTKVVNQRRLLYQLHLLQENF